MTAFRQKSTWGVGVRGRIQRDLDGTTRNKKVFAVIPSRLEEMGHTRNTEQCRLKIKKLTQDYRKVKDHNNRSGADRKTNTWFEALDAVLGHRPTNMCRNNIVDSAKSPVICDDVSQGWSLMMSFGAGTSFYASGKLTQKKYNTFGTVPGVVEKCHLWSKLSMKGSHLLGHPGLRALLKDQQPC
uniref:Myb/SANT-like DNA-binding domain-containing protein n=1 Tax=Paramormyrops kingsleyae TaxID=1676925 RepID=A0A3B3SI09_9TELE